jgi:phage-related protein
MNPMKKLRFIGASIDDLRNFPAEVRREGIELAIRRYQQIGA